MQISDWLGDFSSIGHVYYSLIIIIILFVFIVSRNLTNVFQNSRPFLLYFEKTFVTTKCSLLFYLNFAKFLIWCSLGIALSQWERNFLFFELRPKVKKNRLRFLPTHNNCLTSAHRVYMKQRLISCLCPGRNHNRLHPSKQYVIMVRCDILIVD